MAACRAISSISQVIADIPSDEQFPKIQCQNMVYTKRNSDDDLIKLTQISQRNYRAKRGNNNSQEIIAV